RGRTDIEGMHGMLLRSCVYGFSSDPGRGGSARTITQRGGGVGLVWSLWFCFVSQVKLPPKPTAKIERSTATNPARRSSSTHAWRGAAADLEDRTGRGIGITPSRSADQTP